MPTINKTFLDRTNEPGLYSDDKLVGFRLKVTPTGSKVYLVYAKVKGYAKPVKVTIGHHGKQDREGNTWTPERARKEAERIRGLMLAGINPNEERKSNVAAKDAQRAKEESIAKQKRLTLRKVFDDYIGSKKLKDNTAYVYRCELFKCLADWLDLPLLQIDKDMVEKRHRKISETHPGQANHVMRIFRALYNYAAITYEDFERQPIFKTNPTKRLSQLKIWNKLKARQDVVQDHQLKDWFEAVMLLERDTVRDYLIVLILTGFRRDEAAQLLWSDVDFDAKTITARDTKNGRDHTLPLPPYLYSLLKARSATHTGTFVFPALRRKHGPITDVYDDIKIVCSSSGVYFTPHTLRRTFSTVAGRLFPDYVVRRLTNHIDSTDVTQGYVIIETEKLRQPMKELNEYILDHAGLLQGGPDERQTESNTTAVIPV